MIAQYALSAQNSATMLKAHTPKSAHGNPKCSWKSEVLMEIQSAHGNQKCSWKSKALMVIKKCSWKSKVFVQIKNAHQEVLAVLMCSKEKTK